MRAVLSTCSLYHNLFLSSPEESVMRVYCAQIAQVWNDPDTAFARAHDAVLRALEDDADLVMFSEQYATGWRSAGDGCDTVSGDEVKARWLSLAREFGVAIAGSYAREMPGALPQNVMLVAACAGRFLRSMRRCICLRPTERICGTLRELRRSVFRTGA